mmetsp:Transcript_11392/g.36149  ORF Transcript_11392/g.36149 Transcript_11392/m.36149 type:complete len:367 (-) Transcript_11392:67-1167(-)
MTSSSSSSSTGWSRFYASADLRGEIQKDLDRLVVSGLGEDHFARSAFASCMLTVLTVWATAHPEVGYCQGMHEILALVVLALEDETAYGCRDSGDDASREADLFALFDALMLGHADNFRAGKGAPVLEACRLAQSSLLARRDPRLARSLDLLGIEPQLYGLRWLRLIFSREFEAPASLALCDAVLAAAADRATPPTPDAFRAALQHFFVSLLVASAPRLLAARDEMDCLAILMRPQETSVPDLLRIARHLDDAPAPAERDRGHLDQPPPAATAAASDDPLVGAPPPEDARRRAAPIRFPTTTPVLRNLADAATPVEINHPAADDDDLALTLDSALSTLAKYANTPEAVAALDKIRFVADRLRVASV